MFQRPFPFFDYKLNSIFNTASILAQKDQTSNIFVNWRVLFQCFKKPWNYGCVWGLFERCYDLYFSLQIGTQLDWTRERRSHPLLFWKVLACFSISQAWVWFDLESPPNKVTVSLLWDTLLGNLLGFFFQRLISWISGWREKVNSLGSLFTGH